MSRPYVLVVNDIPLALTNARRWLDSAGFEVETVETGKDGCDSCRRRKPSLILLDYHLKKDSKPGGSGSMTGIDFVPEFRRACPGVCIVMMSATIEERDLPPGERIQVDGFIYVNGGKFEWSTLPELVMGFLE